MLFTPGPLGPLTLPNRLIRSATAEKMALPDGSPKPDLEALYRELARGGVGLIITGHMYVSEEGKCHPEMTGIHRDDLILDLQQLTEAVHQEGGKIAVQINHGGGNCAPETVADPVAPSAEPGEIFKQPARQITEEEIQQVISDFRKAAQRGAAAGFDAVQIHSAHGYLLSQFLSPLTNQREDDWGGTLEKRSRLLRQVCQQTRDQLGPDYPLLVKFGIADGKAGGLTLEDGLQLVERMAAWGVDGIEISSGFSGDDFRSIQKGVRLADQEAYFLPFVQQARMVTDLPLLAVGGFRSRKVMEQALLSGAADFISLSRPLIREPDLPVLFKKGEKERSSCLSANNCWPENAQEGISCKCPPLSEEGSS